MGKIAGANNVSGALPGKWVFDNAETHLPGSGAIAGANNFFLESYLGSGYSL